MLPVAEKTIVLDAGHGGWDPGKTGKTGVDEQELNLAIVKKLQAYLEQGGARVYVTGGTAWLWDRANRRTCGCGKKSPMKAARTFW